jgi:O-antigen ligase
MLPVLAAFCIIRLGWRATTVYAPLKLPLAFTISYLVVQITFHDAFIMGERGFFTWILALIIIQSLCLRQGFLHRCALVLFVMGLITLPYLNFKGSVAGSREQAAVGSMVSGDFTNSNGLGAWFGFCCLYFTIVSIETKRVGIRVASSLAAVGCLYIVGLTISRGALMATAIGITIALRGLLKRGFVPLLVFIIAGGIMHNFGVFDRITSHYAARGMEETGRGLVWPVAIERFLSSPLTGVGTANIATYVSGRRRPFTTHNGFIFVALSSGILPFALFVAWWIRAAQNAFSHDKRLPYSTFRIPLLVYTFMQTLVGDLPFMAPWGILTFAVVMASSIPYGGAALSCTALRRWRAQRFGHHAEAGPLIRIVHR